MSKPKHPLITIRVFKSPDIAREQFKDFCKFLEKREVFTANLCNLYVDVEKFRFYFKHKDELEGLRGMKVETIDIVNWAPSKQEISLLRRAINTKTSTKTKISWCNE